MSASSTASIYTISNKREMMHVHIFWSRRYLCDVVRVDEKIEVLVRVIDGGERTTSFLNK